MGVRTFTNSDNKATLPQGEWTPREELEYTSFLSGGRKEVPFLSIRAVKWRIWVSTLPSIPRPQLHYLARESQRKQKVFIKIRGS